MDLSPFTSLLYWRLWVALWTGNQVCWTLGFMNQLQAQCLIHREMGRGCSCNRYYVLSLAVFQISTRPCPVMLKLCWIHLNKVYAKKSKFWEIAKLTCIAINQNSISLAASYLKESWYFSQLLLKCSGRAYKAMGTQQSLSLTSSALKLLRTTTFPDLVNWGKIGFRNQGSTIYIAIVFLWLKKRGNKYKCSHQKKHF